MAVLVQNSTFVAHTNISEMLTENRPQPATSHSLEPLPAMLEKRPCKITTTGFDILTF